MDLSDLWRGLLTPRRAAVLAMRLPAGAQVWIEAGLDMAWTPGEHLAAYLADIAQAGNWQRGGGKGDQPTPLPRPGDATRAEVESARLAERARKFKMKQRGGT